MTYQLLNLPGCAPTPLAHYLKALGILRLVAQQKDRTVRGLWVNDEFALVTRLSREELITFFVDEYVPTPLLTPWNGGSGFYPKDQKVGIHAIVESDHPRFLPYRVAIETARQIVGDRAESPKNEEKAQLIKRCKAAWTGAAIEWADAATVVTSTAEIAYPGLLGSGGNDGRLDFANNFMQRLTELLSTRAATPVSQRVSGLLSQALWRAPVPGLEREAIGQFLPGSAGGPNSGWGFSGSPPLNPWDFILMLEGALLFQVSSVRRLDRAAPSQASAPFAVRARAAGYGSAAAADESARGEQWFPLWERPSTFAEVRQLFGEGRLQAGTRRAGEAIQAAQALSRLGTARGVSAFQRYAFMERNGQANLAVPIGRWKVSSVPRTDTQILDEIEDWVARLRRAGAPFDKHARTLEALMLEFCQQSEGNTSHIAERVLEALGEAEAELVRRPRAAGKCASGPLRLGPIQRLSAGWIQRVGEAGSVEFRLALAIASQRGPKGQSLREHFVPLEGRRFKVQQEALALGPDVTWTDRNLIANLTMLLLRRLRSADKKQPLPLIGLNPAPLVDVVAFLRGSVDEARIGPLTRALLAVDGERASVASSGAERALTGAELKLEVPADYALFRTLYSPWAFDAEVQAAGQGARVTLAPRCDLRPLRFLESGRLEAAADVALSTLSQGGARPKLRGFMGGGSHAQRLAAALAIPISRRDMQRLAALIFKPEVVAAQFKAQSLD